MVKRKKELVNVSKVLVAPCRAELTVALVRGAVAFLMCLGLSAFMAEQAPAVESHQLAQKVAETHRPLAKITPIRLPSSQLGPADARRRWPALWADILLLLLAPEEWGELSPAVADKLARLIASNQPQAGDVLVAAIADPEHSFRMRATRAFFKNWEAMGPQQIDAYLQSTIQLVARPRKRYPRGVDATAALRYDVSYGWGGRSMEQCKTWTSTILDGKPYGNTLAYEATLATVGWVFTKDLSLGRHTVSLEQKYEFTHHGAKHTRYVKSPEFTFEMVDAATPDDLIAPPDPEVDKLVQDSVRIAETHKALEEWSVSRGISRDDPESWAPMLSWQSPTGQVYSWHFPVWTLTQPLPVDLCFEAEIQDVNTGKTYETNPVIVQRGKVFSYHFLPSTVIEHFSLSQSGFVSVRILLKPSRALALSNPEIEHYYPGSITSGVLRVKVVKSQGN
jgi:hypothetical protein